MARKPKMYSRLTRNVGGVGTYSSLWLGPDHLLIVNSTGFTDSYARLQLSDIQGIFLTPSERRLWWALCWGVPAAFGGTVTLIDLLQHESAVFAPVFFGIGLLGLVWNHLLGAGCRAFVVTGVQTAKLSSLVRVKKARRVLARVQPLIVAAQAGLVPPAPPSMPATAPTVDPPAPPPVSTAEAEAAPEPPSANG